MARPVYWIGELPDVCRLTGEKLHMWFIDGKTKAGPWAIMSVKAHQAHGCGLGQGRGQKYEYQPNTGRWLKVEG